jgi:hypothetical protein
VGGATIRSNRGARAEELAAKNSARVIFRKPFAESDCGESESLRSIQQVIRPLQAGFCILHSEFSIKKGRAPACAAESPKLSLPGAAPGRLDLNEEWSG